MSVIGLRMVIKGKNYDVRITKIVK